jgi:LysM repeat protein
MKKIAYGLLTLAATSFVILVGFVAFVMGQAQSTPEPTATPIVEATNETLPTLARTATPSPTVVPTVTRTLLPPPTIEPPTSTPPPSETPMPSPTATFLIAVDIPGLNGAETATPTSTPGCEVNPDWQLTYEVQANDALASIAARYNLYTDQLATGNCITDPNVISVGQVIHVPGSAHPAEAQYDCNWEVLTPIQNAFDVPDQGTLTFNWIGPDAYRNMIRLHGPDGTVYEWVIDLRQNHTVEIEDIPLGGRYTWYVYPLDEYFVQIPCAEGGPWVFNKDQLPYSTSTPTASP